MKREQDEKQKQRKAKQKQKGSGVWKPHEPTENETGVQTSETINNECVACFGIHKDDMLPDGELDCKKWSIASVYNWMIRT